MPASYANFYIGNRMVLMPAYGQPQDAAAQTILQCFLTAACWPGFLHYLGPGLVSLPYRAGTAGFNIICPLLESFHPAGLASVQFIP